MRKYDPELGRFTLPDPLWEKYYGWTPWQYSYNNPMFFLDENGKNGVAIVGDGVITVHAVYLVNPDHYSANEIRDMQNEINNTLNGQNYSVSDGDYSGYNVIFDLQFKAQNDGDNFYDFANEKYNDIPVGNSFELSSEEVKSKVVDKRGGRYEFKEGVNGGITSDHKMIRMYKNGDDNLNRIHEIFHTLFFDNDNATSGIGSYFNKSLPNQNDINNMINNPSLPKLPE